MRSQEPDEANGMLVTCRPAQVTSSLNLQLRRDLVQEFQIHRNFYGFFSILCLKFLRVVISD